MGIRASPGHCGPVHHTHTLWQTEIHTYTRTGSSSLLGFILFYSFNQSINASFHFRNMAPHLTQVSGIATNEKRETPPPRWHRTPEHCSWSDCLYPREPADEEEPEPSAEEAPPSWENASTADETRGQRHLQYLVVNIVCGTGHVRERERETWMLQVDSSEYPLNPGFHDNVTLSTMLRTWSCTGAAGKTEIDQQSVINQYVWSMLTL